MKSVLTLIIAVFLVAVLPHALAEQQLAKRSAHDKCVLKYLSCRDNCEYHADESSIAPCKKSCDKQHTCRPKRSNSLSVKGNPLMQN